MRYPSQGYNKGYSDGYVSGNAAGQKSVRGTSSNETVANSFSEFLLTYKGQSQPSSTVPTAPVQNNPDSFIVYVSKNKMIHSSQNCSGMKYYEEMDFDVAISQDKYKLCSKCWK